MAAELEAKCGCAHCGNNIAFPLEAAGMEVACPHCGEMTELAVEPAALDAHITATGSPSFAKVAAGNPAFSAPAAESENSTERVSDETSIAPEATQ